MLAEDVVFTLQKEILKEYPKNVKSYDEWLIYLDKIEHKVKLLDLQSNSVNILLKLYEGALGVLGEDWNNQSYLIIFFRRAILYIHEDFDQGSVLLTFCSMNARHNPQLIAALSSFYYRQGANEKFKSLLKSAEKYMDSRGIQLLNEVENAIENNKELKHLLGPFYYELAFNSDFNTDFTFVSSLNYTSVSQSYSRINLPHETSFKVKSTRSTSPEKSTNLQSTQNTCSITSELEMHSEPVHETGFQNRIFEESKFSGSVELKVHRKPLTDLQIDQSGVIQHSKMVPVGSSLLSVVIGTDSVNCSTNAINSTISSVSKKQNCSQQQSQPQNLQQTSSYSMEICSDGPFQNKSQSQLQITEIKESSRLCDIGVQTMLNKDLPDFLTVNHHTYYVIDELGRGGSSVVYGVIDSDRNSWAIKKVNLRNAPTELVQSYVNEINMLKCLENSERVVRLHDFEQNPEYLLMVMERGNHDLKDVLIGFLSETEPSCLNRNSTTTIAMSSIAVAFYWDQMLRCVKALHDHRIVHLDLKPQNFVLIRGGLKLIDLGISRRLPDDCTSIHQVLTLGTLSFMSPEQLDGTVGHDPNLSFNCRKENISENQIKVGFKSDIWSLGIILYFMVYGQSPFKQQSTLQSRLMAILNPNVEIPFPLIKNPAIYKALRRSLVRDYRQRASVDELLSYEYLSTS